MRLSLILPVFNGCNELKKNFMPIYREMQKIGDFEIIIAEDGSTDCTKEVAKDFAMLDNVRLLSRKSRLGKGAAIRNAIAVAKGNTIGYMDIDMAVPVKYVRSALQKVEQGHKIVLGSRYVKGARIRRTNHRLIESVAFNMLVRMLLDSKVRDHQCGFKFWNAAYIRKAITKVRDNHWFFDAEILVRAQRSGIVPYEMPVEWAEGRKTHVKARDLPSFFRPILELRKELGKESAREPHA